MGTQTEIAEKIKGKKADYVLAVKENQKTLYEEIKEYLNDEEFKEKIKEQLPVFLKILFDIINNMVYTNGIYFLKGKEE